MQANYRWRRGAEAPLFVFSNRMIDKTQVKEIVESYLLGSDKYVVEVTVRPDNLIVVEIDSDTSVAIDDCIKLTKFIESKLDREVEDYELEVGSAGITQPFRVLRQYQKYIGKEVEVLSRDGRKLAGLLKDADEQGFTLTIAKQVKPEGAKRKVTVEEDIPFTYEEIKYTKYIIRF